MNFVSLKLVVAFALFVGCELIPVPVIDGVVALTIADELETPVPVG